MKPSTNGQFSLREARAIVHDLFHPDPRVYWTDFLATILVGHLAAAGVRALPMVWDGPRSAQLVIQGVLFIVSCLLYYRAAMFIHELTHLPQDGFNLFRKVWNILCGIPFLVPSFVYFTHLHHHRRKHFGTEHDGEYAPFGHRPPVLIVLYFAEALILPILGIVRFLVLTPLMWMSPSLRKWIHQHASSLVIDPTFVRPLPAQDALRLIRRQELFCFLWLLSIIVITRVVFDRWPYPFLLQAYPTAVAIIFLNSLRTIVSHRWYSEGQESTYLEQMLDSTNFPHRGWLNEWWAPVGLRFHALHHLFPAMPYHNLAEGHRRLAERLPKDSLYHLTEQKSFLSTLAELWRRSKEHRRPKTHPSKTEKPSRRGKKTAGRRQSPYAKT